MASLGCAFYGQLRRAVHDEDVPARLYVVLLLLLTADALLNSFLFYPALLLTGTCANRYRVALAVSPSDRKSTRLLQSLMRRSYAVFCLKKKNTKHTRRRNHNS